MTWVKEHQYEAIVRKKILPSKGNTLTFSVNKKAKVSWLLYTKRSTSPAISKQNWMLPSPLWMSQKLSF